MSIIINISDLHFHGDRYNARYDSCAHGKIYIKIGNEVVYDGNYKEWNVSCFVLRLMKAISIEHIEDYSSPLISKKEYKTLDINDLIENNSEETYPNAKVKDKNVIDFSIIPLEDNIKIVTTNDKVVVVPMCEYRKLITELADMIEKFYADNEDKEFDELDAHDSEKEYADFWNLWNSYRRRIDNKLFDSPEILGINHSNPYNIEADSITKITKNGIYYKVEGEAKFIDFQLCAYVYEKENILYNNKIVAKRIKTTFEVDDERNELQFFTYPRTTIIKFSELTFLDKLFNSEKLSIAKLEDKLKKYGWKIK